MNKQNPFTDAQLRSVGKLAGGFVDERINGIMDEIEARLGPPQIDTNDEKTRLIYYDRDTVMGVVGRMLGTAYFKGYADAKEGIQPKSLYIPKSIK